MKKMEFLNRKVSWVAITLVASLTLTTVQQIKLNQAHRNERSADVSAMRISLENSALRLRCAQLEAIE